MDHVLVQTNGPLLIIAGDERERLYSIGLFLIKLGIITGGKMSMLKSDPEILEIGYIAFFKRLMPDRTLFVAVEAAVEEHKHSDLMLCRRTWAQLESLLSDRRFAVVLLRVHHRPGPLFVRLLRRLAGSNTMLSRVVGVGRGAAAPLPAPLVVLDFEDESFIHTSLIPVLSAASHVFKRELPADRWRVFLPNAGEACDEGLRRSDVPTRQLLEKLRPLPLGLPLDDRRFAIPRERTPKTSDVFFAGRVECNSWLRHRGLAELETLRARGLSVDLPAEPLRPTEFYSRCAAARLTWSPQGYGWDCFRHYEAAACGSVPVINFPPIERHEGLADRRHALFYDPRPGGLTDTILNFIEDKEHLVRMGEAAREHAMRHHTPEAIAKLILASAGLSM